MVSNHFSGIYGHRLSWLLLLVIIVAGVAVRHVLNVRWKYPQWKPALAATIAASIVALFVIMNVGSPPTSAADSSSFAPVTFEDARHVIDRRCAACHSEHPSDLTFGAAPGGVMFDTPEQIIARAARIRERAVISRTMPPGNKTNITDEERALLGRWINGGASK